MYEAATGLDRERFTELPAAELPPNEQEAFAHYNEVVLRACHAEPKQRFESAAELQSALAELSGSQGSPRQRRTIWDWLRPRR